jgi:hypothetical protein
MMLCYMRGSYIWFVMTNFLTSLWLQYGFCYHWTYLHIPLEQSSIRLFYRLNAVITCNENI